MMEEGGGDVIRVGGRREGGGDVIGGDVIGGERGET